MTDYPHYKVAAAQVAPVFLNTPATVDKACELIAEAARNGAQLIAFPETYIPAFPVWAALYAPIQNHEFFCRLAASAIRYPGVEIERIAESARRYGIMVSIGVNEGTEASVGCIWNSNILIGEDGRILNHHRKLVPTFYEKLIWANGDGAGIRVSATPLGRIGMLICGENTNPLARYTLMAEGEQVHIASYPPVWPTRDPGRGGNYDLARAIHIRAGAHAFEGKVFNIVVSGFIDQPMINELAHFDAEVRRILEQTPRGVSLVIAPNGEAIAELSGSEEGLLYAEIDLAACVEPKQFHDVSGGYNRFDVFQLTVDRTRRPPAHFKAETIPALAEEGGISEMSERD
jgi:aliphatic nitrilase